MASDKTRTEHALDHVRLYGLLLAYVMLFLIALFALKSLSDSQARIKENQAIIIALQQHTLSRLQISILNQIKVLNNQRLLCLNDVIYTRGDRDASAAVTGHLAANCAVINREVEPPKP